MQFAKDLFISYAHIDNQPLTPEQQGWITRFHVSLEALLSMRLGGTARIWRDEKLQGNDIFADEITDQFTQTAVLVSVLTPRYLNSEWCNKEVAEFCKCAQQNGGMMIENKARLFKILKSPVDTEASLPAVMQDVLGYEFYTFEDNSPLELDPAYGEKYAQDYNRKVGKLAWDISQLLKTLDVDTDSGDADQQGQETDKTLIYLAECSYDQKKTREILEGELQRHGYVVLPDQQLPMDESEYKVAVAGLLERCHLAIHLVGSAYGAVPDGPSQKSVVVLQNELAVERCKSGDFSRLIWLPEGTHSEQDQQQAFIETLHLNAEVQWGADLITGDIEALKNSIHTTLQKLKEPRFLQTDKQDITVDKSRHIYLICDEKDRKATLPIRKFCRDQGFEIAIPAFEGDAAAVRKANQQMLSSCDAVILFYGAGDEAWKRTLDNELKKMPGYREGKPLLTSYTYLATPETSDKQDLIDLEEPNLINGLAGFSESEMGEFVQSINTNGTTP